MASDSRSTSASAISLGGTSSSASEIVAKSGKTCKWCFVVRGVASNAMKELIVELRAQDVVVTIFMAQSMTMTSDVVPWCKGDRLECDLCRQYIEWKFKWEKKVKLLADLDTQDPDRVTFKEGRREYMTMRLTDGRAQPSNHPRGEVVQKTQKQLIEAKMTIGVWWPTDKWLERFSETEVPEGKVHVVKRAGKTLKGVLEDSSHGCPDGCIILSGIWQEGAEKLSEAETEERGGSEGVEAAWKQLSGAHSMSITDNEDGSRKIKAQAGSFSRKRSADQEFDDGTDRKFNLNMWTPRKKQKGDRDDDKSQSENAESPVAQGPHPTSDERGRQKATPKKKSVGQSSSANAPVRKAGRPSGMTVQTRMKELASATQLRTECVMLMKTILHGDAIRTVSANKFATVKKKIDSKLEAKLDLVYASKDDDDESLREMQGAKVRRELVCLQVVFGRYEALQNCVRATEGVYYSAKMLREAIDDLFSVLPNDELDIQQRERVPISAISLLVERAAREPLAMATIVDPDWEPRAEAFRGSCEILSLAYEDEGVVSETTKKYGMASFELVVDCDALSNKQGMVQLNTLLAISKELLLCLDERYDDALNNAQDAVEKDKVEQVAFSHAACVLSCFGKAIAKWIRPKLTQECADMAETFESLDFDSRTVTEANELIGKICSAKRHPLRRCFGSGVGALLAKMVATKTNLQSSEEYHVEILEGLLGRIHNICFKRMSEGLDAASSIGQVVSVLQPLAGVQREYRGAMVKVGPEFKEAHVVLLKELDEQLDIARSEVANARTRAFRRALCEGLVICTKVLQNGASASGVDSSVQAAKQKLDIFKESSFYTKEESVVIALLDAQYRAFCDALLDVSKTPGCLKVDQPHIQGALVQLLDEASFLYDAATSEDIAIVKSFAQALVDKVAIVVAGRVGDELADLVALCEPLANNSVPFAGAAVECVCAAEINKKEAALRVFQQPLYMKVFEAQRVVKGVEVNADEKRATLRFELALVVAPLAVVLQPLYFWENAVCSNKAVPDVSMQISELGKHEASIKNVLNNLVALKRLVSEHVPEDTWLHDTVEKKANLVVQAQWSQLLKSITNVTSAYEKQKGDSIDVAKTFAELEDTSLDHLHLVFYDVAHIGQVKKKLKTAHANLKAARKQWQRVGVSLERAWPDASRKKDVDAELLRFPHKEAESFFANVVAMNAMLRKKRLQRIAKIS